MKQINKFKKQKFTKAFTLIEVMVSVSIFLIVAFVVTTTFVSAMDAYRKAQQIRLIIDNVNYAMDAMVIDIREGTDYLAPNGTKFDFRDFNGDAKTYQLTSTDPKKIQKCDSVGQCSDLTAENVSIDNLNFRVTNYDGLPPMVQVNVYGKVLLRGMITDMNLQTTITQRNSRS